MAYFPVRALALGASLLALSACDDNGNFDFDLRDFGGAFDTSAAAAAATANRPVPDDRGILSYPNYQVAVARRGDTMVSLAARVGLPANELAEYNGIPANTPLRANEVIVLPRRVAEPSAETGALTAGPLKPAETIDITTIAGNAIDKANAAKSTAPAPGQPKDTSGAEPLRHKVERGETAYSISRLYGVSVRALAEWNGLTGDLSLREGQYLLIPVTIAKAPAPSSDTTPGQGTLAPTPPSASTALPEDETREVAAAQAPATPDLKTTAASAARFAWPVSGAVIRDYEKKKYDGIDIAAKPGTVVKAADDGTVAVITRDTDQVPILVIRHTGNVLTVYTGIDNISVKKGEKVKRGQAVAKVRSASPSFLHFEVREGLESVDPTPYLDGTL